MPGPGAPRGAGVGVLLIMDDHKVDYIRDANGVWGPEGMFLMPDGTFDLSWPHRCIMELIKKEWVEVITWSDRMSPLRVRRTAKPGDSPYV